MSQGDNRRQFERTDLDLNIRFTTADNNETVGQLIDISAGGLAMATDVRAEKGDSIIAYPDKLGRLTGKVVRIFDGGFAIEFEISDKQRAHLQKRIDSVITGVPYIRMLENRKHNRIELNLDSQACIEPSGETFSCQITDISKTGVQIRSDEAPPIGTFLRVGSLRGIVCRYTDDGFALEFAKADAAAPPVTAKKAEACA